MVQLEGIVLHSMNIDSTSRFYGALLGTEFREEKHGDGPKHYAGHLENGMLLEIYPLPKEKSSPVQVAPIIISDPSLIFRVSNLEAVLETIKEYTLGKVELLSYGAKTCDPDGRTIYLHRVK